MTVLITGGAGFIGANFVLDWLSVEDRPIVNLDKLKYAGNMKSLAAVLDDQRHTFVQADIADTETVSELLDAHRPRAIVHCVAESHVDRSINADKIKTALAWDASETFQSGLRKTVQWYLNNEDWIAEVESGEYRTRVDSHYGQAAVGQ